MCMSISQLEIVPACANHIVMFVGDCGSVDSKGYLFITGRSKEIINRGGETISPFEIEEAIVQHPYVKEVIAFSAPHDQYQETVGAVIVTRPDKPRVDLPSLHQYLESRLHRSKWPQVIVYSDSLPKNAAGKTLRIKFSDRIGLKAVDEESSPLSRIYEAKCPPIGTALTVPIPISPVTVNYEATLVFLRQQRELNDVGVVVLDLPSRMDALVACVVLNNMSSKTAAQHVLVVLKDILNRCAQQLHQYLVPCEIYDVAAIPVTTDKGGRIVTNMVELKTMASSLYEARNIVAPRNNIERQVELVWRAMLGSPTVISVTSSFFDLGGDSLKAGQVIGAMRSELRVPLTVADLFTAPTIAAMAAKISTLKTLGSPQLASKTKSPLETVTRNANRRLAANKYQSTLASIEEDKRERLNREYMTWDFTPPYLNTSFYALFVQALPIAVIYPIRRIAIWFMIAAPWVHLMRQGYGRFNALLMAMFIARLFIGLGAPLLGILAKWLIIGKYKAGRYPLWGAMYLKWWIVEQIINIMGKGFFRDDLPIIGVHMVRLYYVLMGADIGHNVKIHKDAKIGQADLLTVGDNVAIDNCTIRPFAIEEGHFTLLPIKIGAKSSVGVKSVIAPGSVVPDHTCIGPLSSSHEVQDADRKYRQYCRPMYQPPPAWMIIFLGVPMILLVLAVSFIPWFFVLKLMVYNAQTGGWYQSDLHSIYHAFLWWITPQRLCYFFLLRVVKRCVVPYIKLAMMILIKRLIIGRFTEMDEQEKSRSWNRFRYWFMSKMLPGGGLAGVSKLVGTHYEIVSIIYRMMGAKIGKRVYWPGSGLELVEFDLLEVGNDVVFGSRSVIITSSTTCSKKVVFEDGAMVADRCVILPGARVKRGAVLGSGALAAEDMVVPVGSIWVGSQNGKALNVAPPDQTYNSCSTLSPFGKAFYKHQASYSVIPLWMIVFYNTTWQAFCTCYRNCPTALSLMLCSYLMQFDPFDDKSPGELFRVSLVAFSPLYLFLCTTALGIDIIGKWVLLGRRKAGVYAWDESSYCQRWQLYLTLQEIRRGERHKTGNFILIWYSTPNSALTKYSFYLGILDMIQGSAYLVWYFRLLGAKIGNNVCLYPNGGDPMMTEPDLVTIGDFAGIDDASLIAHINTRGMFRLNPLSVGTGCVLKSMSRLLSGSSMQAHSILQEHTLVLAGEEVEAGSVWQGWPTRSQISLKEHRGRVQDILDELSLRIVRENQSAPSSTVKTTDKKGYGAIDDEDSNLRLLGDEEEGKKPTGRARAASGVGSSELRLLLGKK
ncbi:hypothetical protein EON64_01440 [archaeon]|nr:MAG: hypothetical protein EON64_01440 [archaeon]